MSYPLGTTAAQLSQAVGEACLISNAGGSDLYLAAGSSVGPNAYDVRLPVGSSLQWGGGTLWGVAAGSGGAYAVLYTAGGVGGGVVNGASVPVPPSAAAIGTAVGGSVPVPPSAAAIGAAVPAPPSATAIGTAVGAPGAGAIATSIYNQGIRSVDAPTRNNYQLYYTTDGTFQAVTFDVSQANSVDIAWYFLLGTVRTAGTRTWAMLSLQWLDALGNVIHNDGFELCNINTSVNVSGHQGAIRVPALGASLRVVFRNNQWNAPGLVAATTPSTADSAIVNVLLSSRATDRTRYFPASIQGGTFFGPAFTGLLYGAQPPQTVAAGATSPRITLEAFSGPLELHFLAANASGLLEVFAGAVGDGTSSYSHFVPMTAGTRYLLTVPGIRSQYTVAFLNQGTVSANFYLQAVASDI